MDMKPLKTVRVSLLRLLNSLFLGTLFFVTSYTWASRHAVDDEGFASLIDQVSLFSPVNQEKQVKIAIVYPGLQSSDYWQRSISALKGRLDDLGVKYVLDIRFSKPHIEQALQEEQIIEMLELAPDYLVYTIDSIRQQRMVEALLQRGKPKLIIQNLTRPIADWYDIQPLIYIGFDHVEGAQKLAKHFMKRFPENTQYGIIFWGEGVVSDQRGLTFEREIGNYHQLKTSYFAVDPLQAKRAVLAMLNDYPDLKYIYVCATGAALGAIDALQELGRSDVDINGWGGGQAELDAFQKGQLDVVLMRMNDQNGIAMAEAIRLDMQGWSIPNVYAGDFRLLTQGMETDIVEKLIKEAFVYSGDSAK
ncbi:autoinducer 2-binding periplasmic protein LuxP [Neptunomonas antarctica]|uniref:Monosaccharide ABC transporter substrate-binding protein, CUT2 family n=1 Tax=Neptunomonas antarctica TaxID=619304 RepID=A0A1N7M5V3_9GAMM|nr:autoinducer 2-binding periplasmic protein LuxP [Neptunomonas antarctica]SIS81454.1 monosaccharide ABC transporter substrate-binding protein, CUT2 family [Neptunomonas antarctica]